jgi:HEAT repeat protein
MTTLLLLLASASPSQPPTTAAEVAPAPVVVPDAKQLAAWVADLSAQDNDRRRAAINALVKAGPRAKSAVPDLIKLLKEKDWRADNIIEILGAIGPDAKDAVPHLLALLKPTGYGFVNDRIAVAVAKVDAPKLEATRALLLTPSKGHDISLLGSRYLREYAALVVPHVVELCQHKDADVRVKAVGLLGSLETRVFPQGHGGKAGVSLLSLAGDGAKGIPAALEKLLGDDDVTVRVAAAGAIAQVAPQLAGKTIPVLVAVMRDEKLLAKAGQFHAAVIFRPVPGAAAEALIPLFDSEKEQTRYWAINTLAALPVQAQLEAALKDGKTARTRQAAAITLGSRRSDAAPSAPALKAALGDREFVVRFAAAQALVQVGLRGGESAAAVPVLIEGLKHDDEKVRSEASQTLVSVGEPAKAAIPDLKRLLGDKKPAVALEAALALVEIVPADAADAVPVLTRGLGAADSEAIRAARALTKLGPVAKSAIPELIKKFDAKNVHLRLAAAEAAARIDPAQADKATEILVALLKDKKHKSSMVRTYATQSLLRIGSGAKAAVPTLLELLKDDGPFHGEIALAAIAIDPESGKPALAWVREVLSQDTSNEDTYDLIESFALLGPKAKAFVPELIAMLGSKTPFTQKNAIIALREMGPEAKDALPALKELAAKEQRQNIRRLAGEAVKAIEGK